MSVELLGELPRAVRECDERDDVHAILTGADPVFCAGLDLKQLARAMNAEVAPRLGASPRGEPTTSVDGRRVGGAPDSPDPTPLIGAINGVR